MSPPIFPDLAGIWNYGSRAPGHSAARVINPEPQFILDPSTVRPEALQELLEGYRSDVTPRRLKELIVFACAATSAAETTGHLAWLDERSPWPQVTGSAAGQLEPGAAQGLTGRVKIWASSRLWGTGAGGEQEPRPTVSDALATRESQLVPAKELKERLQVWDYSIGRRVIHIRDLSPPFVAALFASSTFENVHALIKLMSYYLDPQISILATCLNLPGVQLEFTLFSYKLYHPDSEEEGEDPRNLPGTPGPKPRRNEIDITCLTRPLAGRAVGRMVLRQVVVSLMVVGDHERRWTAYGFVDSLAADDDLDEYCEGPIFPDPNGVQVMPADKPRVQPRSYFLRLLRDRLEQACRNWNEVYEEVNRGIQESRSHKLSDPEKPMAARAAEQKEAIRARKGALDQLIDAIHILVCQLRMFMDSNGDMRLFKIEEGSPAWDPAFPSILQDIERSTLSLNFCCQQFISLKKRCNEDANDLDRQLSFERNQVVKDSGRITEYTALVLGPVALTATVFSMQPEALPFPPSPQAFALMNVAMLIFSLIIGRYLACSGKLVKNAFKWIEAQQLNVRAILLAKQRAGVRDLEMGHVEELEEERH